MSRPHLVAAVVLIAQAILPQAFAGPLRWFCGGPRDSATSVLVVDPVVPSIVWAGTSDGVYRSEDAGLTWNRRWADRQPEPILGLAVNPDRTDSLIALVEGSIVVSDDAGKSWFSSAIDRSIVLLQPYPETHPFSVLAAGGESLLWSLDGGVSWRQISGSFPGGDLAPLPWSDGVLLVATGDAILRSGDDGRTWVRVASAPAEHVRVAPGNPDRAYAWWGGHLLKSDDAGLSWIDQSPAPVEADGGFLILPSDEDLLITAGTEGVHRSVNGGASWGETEVPAGPPGRWSDATLAATDPSTVYLSGPANRDAVMVSRDAGLNFLRAGSEIALARELTFAHHSRPWFVAGAPGAYWGSRDGGQSWQVSSHVVGPIVGLTEYGHFAIPNDPAWGPLAITHDFGWSWDSFPTAPYGVTEITDMLNDRFETFAVAQGAIWRTKYLNQDWVRWSEGEFHGKSIVDRSGMRWGPHFAGGDGVLRSDDHGRTWFPCNEGLEVVDGEVVRPLRVYQVGVKWAQPHLILLATEAGVWSGHGNAGEPWQLSSDGLPHVALAAESGSGEGPVAGVTALLVGIIGHREWVFVALHDQTDTIYWSVDGARTWRPFPGVGLPPGDVVQLAVTQDVTSLVAVHGSGGVWFCPFRALLEPRTSAGPRLGP